MEEQTVRSIKELAPKPSDAIQAMLDGLQALSGDGFRVNMNTYGEVRNSLVGSSPPVCFGCAATFAAHWLAGKEPNASLLRSREGRAMHLGFLYTDLEQFERAIDAFRYGRIWPLLSFYGVYDAMINTAGLALTIAQPWYLTNSDWLSQLPAIEAYRARLVELGF